MEEQPNRKIQQYKVGATANGNPMEFTVEATTGTRAVAEARRQAKKDGLQRITVNYVRPIRESDYEDRTDYTTSPDQLGGPHASTGITILQADELPNNKTPSLSLEEINRRIKEMWGRMVVFTPIPEEPPLKAYEQAGHIFLDDGLSGRAQLESLAPMELAMMFYEWATYTGYCSEDFDNFLEICCS